MAEGTEQLEVRTDEFDSDPCGVPNLYQPPVATQKATRYGLTQRQNQTVHLHRTPDQWCGRVRRTRNGSQEAVHGAQTRTATGGEFAGGHPDSANTDRL